MKNKKLIRLICALLSVLMMVGMLPALSLAVSAAEDDSSTKAPPNEKYVQGAYETAEEYLADMTKYYSNGDYSLYCDDPMGIVAYKNEKTGEILFTNPWNMAQETNKADRPRAELMSQIVFTYSKSSKETEVNSYTDAAFKKQISVKPIKNGLRVEYAIGEPSARVLVPEMIERTAFESKILDHVEQAYNDKLITFRDFTKFKEYFNEMFYTDESLSESKKEGIAKKYPVTREKNIDIYVLDVNTSKKEKSWLEEMILTYCPEYTFEEMDNDYDLVGFEEIATSPAVFKMALEYVLEDLGISVTLAGNGLRYDENVYRVKDFKILPYMGASYKQNEGYSFIPDGSGVLYELDSVTTTFSRVYGDDYALQEKLSGYHNEVMRMPVFGQVETAYANKDGQWISKNDYNALSDEEKATCTSESRGFFAIIEQGDSLATIKNNHRANLQYASVIPEFVTRQSDTSAGGWGVYADRRYTDDYSIRYIMLSDDTRAQKAGLTSYYECSWLGMACAYRQYLDNQDNGFERLTADDVSSSIPLYIETFGCMDTVEKVLSMPVTVSVALTSFEDIATMYDYLATNGVTNVNFKMKGYANGGLYADVPYDLDWESAVGGDGGFEDLLEKATEAGFGLYPDFDFVYTSQADVGGSLTMKKHAARTIDNRYTTRRVYSATYQSLVSYYQMVISPAVYNRFYEALEEEYADYQSTGISLGTFGNSLNSDYDEEKITLREEAKEYVIEGLAYFKDKNYDIMLDGGNAYTWSYAKHILNVSIDSSRYISELSAVPFAGVVLHGYKEFAGTPMNMEGNLSYAMLKAMECGASAYFVLCYAKNAASYLKEDEVLSQNYSVRYDIWQKRLVEIYLELNSVLADVQTKLLVNWERLDASRVPDEDELLKDIADAAEAAKKEIADMIEADRLAKLEALSQARTDVSEAAQSILSIHMGTMAEGLRMMLGQLAYNENEQLIGKWARPNTENGEPTKQQADALSSLLNAYVITPYANMLLSMQTAKEAVVKAKVGYDLMKASGVNNQIMTDALAALEAAIAEYVSLLNGVESQTYTLTDAARDAYITGSDSTIEALVALMDVEGDKITVSDADLGAFLFGEEKLDTHKNIGWEAVYDAIIRGLIADGYYDPADAANSLIKVQDLLNFAMTGDTEVPPEEDEEDKEEDDSTGEEGEEGEEGEDEEPEAEVVTPDPPKSKYAVDNNVVAVTYGETKNAPYKTLLLNFNDYTIQTTYNGVTYTIAAYDYVVIMH